MLYDLWFVLNFFARQIKLNSSFLKHQFIVNIYRTKYNNGM